MKDEPKEAQVRWLVPREQNDPGVAAGRLRSLMGRTIGYSSRQEEILDALEEVFLQNGFVDVSITDLVARARCSRRTLYELAPTKEQLFLLVLDRMWRRLDVYAREAVAREDDAAAKLEAFLGRAAEIFRAPSSAFLAAIQTYAPARRVFDDHVAGYIEYMGELIEDGIRAGQLRPMDPRVAAEVLAAATAQVAGRESDPDQPSGPEAVAVAARLALFGLVSREDSRTGAR